MSEGTTVKRNVTVVVLVLTITVAFFAFRHKRVNITGSPAKKATDKLNSMQTEQIQKHEKLKPVDHKVIFKLALEKTANEIIEEEKVYKSTNFQSKVVSKNKEEAFQIETDNEIIKPKKTGKKTDFQSTAVPEKVLEDSEETEALPPKTKSKVDFQSKAVDKNAINKADEVVNAAVEQENSGNNKENFLITTPTSERKLLGVRVEGWNSAIETLDVTETFKPDPDFKKVHQFTIDELVPFFPDAGIHRNSDNSTFENWLAMKFPPNSVWDQNYKTPCYIDYKSGRLRCIPHIYMVGWAKSGTTDMWWHWKNHPQLVPGWKETQFLTQFSFWPDHKTMKTFNELLFYFFDERTKKSQEKFPEHTMYDMTATIIYDNWHWRIKQGYMGDPLIPTHTNFHYLRKLHPGAQIVVMMRNPVTRALSFYNHGIDMSKKKNANLQFVYKDMPQSPLDIHKFFVDSIYHFNECVKKTSLRACCHLSGWESQNWGDPKYFMTLRIGIYYIFLEEVYKNYPPSQVHLVKSEDFYGSPLPTLNQLFTFLNISTQSTERLIQQKGSAIIMSIKKYFKPLIETYKLLQKFYAPFNQRLVSMLDDHKWAEWEKEINRLTGEDKS